ncbi:hypothetical protein GCM10025866_26890 [Naasia aerilata]|uniref:Uncharacterized protein n=1 Tax=Naasia aerilata TaxID=1162966 RepID=A0ABN6XP50_9MICO|nr:hypothetical protein GCM10025866_26890 [Naasia aerilata]
MRTAAAVAVGTPGQLHPLGGLDRVELLGTHPEASDDVAVQHAHAALADGSHRELGIERRAELADEEDVEGRTEHPCHLGRHRHTAAGEPEHDRSAETEGAHRLRQFPARVLPVPEHASTVRPRRPRR